MKLDAVQKGADEALEACQNLIGFGPEGWVPTEYYEEAMARNNQLKEGALVAATSRRNGLRSRGTSLGRHGRGEVHVMNRARYTTVFYLT